MLQIKRQLKTRSQYHEKNVYTEIYSTGFATYVTKDFINVQVLGSLCQYSLHFKKSVFEALTMFNIFFAQKMF